MTRTTTTRATVKGNWKYEPTMLYNFGPFKVSRGCGCSYRWPKGEIKKKETWRDANWRGNITDCFLSSKRLFKWQGGQRSYPQPGFTKQFFWRHIKNDSDTPDKRALLGIHTSTQLLCRQGPESFGVTCWSKTRNKATCGSSDSFKGIWPYCTRDFVSLRSPLPCSNALMTVPVQRPENESQRCRSTTRTRRKGIHYQQPRQVTKRQTRAKTEGCSETSNLPAERHRGRKRKINTEATAVQPSGRARPRFDPDSPEEAEQGRLHAATI